MDDRDVAVEVKDDVHGGPDPTIHPGNVVNQNPNLFVAAYTTVCSYLASYGWPTLFTTVFIIIMWSNLEEKIRKWIEKKNLANNSVRADPEILTKRAEAMERARQRMQEEASAVIQKEAVRRRELEEMKWQERMVNYDAMQKGLSSSATQNRLGHANDTAATQSGSANKQRPLRSDYNPLTGSSSRYRPALRRTGGG